MRDYLPPPEKKASENNDGNNQNPKYDKRWAHFGGKAPFSYVNDDDDKNSNEKKDKDVWDPPPEDY